MYSKYSKKKIFLSLVQHHIACVVLPTVLMVPTLFDYVTDDYITYIIYRQIRVFSLKNLYLITFFALVSIPTRKPNANSIPSKQNYKRCKKMLHSTLKTTTRASHKNEQNVYITT